VSDTETMYDFANAFNRMMPGIIPIIAIVGGISFGMIATFLQYRRVSRKNELDAHLKSLMIERGMSVDEIERVLAAGKKTSEEKCK
jgi:hypothetical protein